jgi:hypothetical protein
MRFWTILIAVVALVGFAALSGAVLPYRATDLELAKSPVIVIGYWVKAPMKPHMLQKGNVIEKYETHTRLMITQVISGDVRVGARPSCVLSVRVGAMTGASQKS